MGLVRGRKRSIGEPDRDNCGQFCAAAKTPQDITLNIKRHRRCRKQGRLVVCWLRCIDDVAAI